LLLSLLLNRTKNLNLKQLFFFQTRNNFKGQLGFNTNQKNPSTPTKKHRDFDLIFAHKNNILPSLISPSQHQKAFDPTFSSRLTSIHSRSKSTDFNGSSKKYADDFNLSYYNHTGLDDLVEYKHSDSERPPGVEPSNRARPPRLSHRHAKTVDACLVEEEDELLKQAASSSQSLEHEQQGVKANNSSMIQPQQQITHTPAIDFKLDVKIEINSGKCILHASKSKDQAQTDRLSYSNYYNMNEASKQAGGKMMNGGSMEPEVSINTNILFPAIKVKAFYESSHKNVDNRLMKKANLYTMIKIESFVMPSFSANLMCKIFLLVLG
jgi:hypothetical protein